MPFWRLYFHVVWATKGREALIDEHAERIVVRSIRTTAKDQGAMIQAIGVMPDHVHVAVSIPPSIAISTFIGRMKGAASHAVNEATGNGGAAFSWQAEYGVLSFGEKNLSAVVAYVENQKARHAADTLWPTMEDFTDRQ